MYIVIQCMSPNTCISYTSQLKTIIATSQPQLLLSVPNCCHQQTRVFKDYLLVRLNLSQ